MATTTRARIPDYAAGSLAADFDWWCGTHLVQSIDQFAGAPLELEPWQRRFFGDALALDADGLPYWKLVVLVVPRKNGKTSMLSAYALYHLLESEGTPEVLLAASSDKQAGRLYDAATLFVRQNEEIDDLVHLREYVGEIVRKDGLGKIIRMASDPGRAHGYNPSLVIADELAFWTTPSLGRAWAAFTTGGGARSNSQIFAITVAGEAAHREDSILGRIIDGNLVAGEVERRGTLTITRNHDARTLVYNYEAPTKKRTDVRALKKANPASWVTTKYLAEQAANPGLSDAEVLQLHGCVWSDGAGVWIGKEKWEECHSELEIPPGAICAVGVDAARTRDTTARAIAWKDPDSDRIVLRSRVWSTIEGKPHDVFVPGGRLDNDLVRDEILDDVMEQVVVRLLFYDERYFDTQADDLSREGLTVVEMHQGKPEMQEAWDLFHALIYGGRRPRLAVDPNDVVLRQHVRNAVGVKTERGWKVSKVKTDKPIDALAAAVMAVYAAEHLDEFTKRTTSWRPL